MLISVDNNRKKLFKFLPFDYGKAELLQIPHFFRQNDLTNLKKFASGAIFCYLLISAVTPPIKTLLLLIFANFIRIQIPFLLPHEISLNAFGTLIFLIQMNSFVQGILSLGQNKGLLPVCSVPFPSIDFKVHSFTDWSAQLKINPLYAILSGFDFGDTPSVGTFYDFLNRLWDSDSDNLSLHIHPVKKKKVKKPKQKGSKEGSIEKTTVDRLFKQLETGTFSIDDRPYASLFMIYHQEFSSQSVSKGLIAPSSLSITGEERLSTFRSVTVKNGKRNLTPEHRQTLLN